MIFAVLGVLIVLGLIYMSLKRFPKPNELPDSDGPFTRYSQYEVFRDLEPNMQTRTNPMTGFLAEDIDLNSKGSIGTFRGREDNARRAPLYMLT
jgi:hypothetical protein